VFGVDHRCGLLDVSVGVVHLVRHAVVTDVEVNKASLRLSAPVTVRRDHHSAEAVELFAFAGGLEPNREFEDLRSRRGGRWHGEDLSRWRWECLKPIRTFYDNIILRYVSSLNP